MKKIIYKKKINKLIMFKLKKVILILNNLIKFLPKKMNKFIKTLIQINRNNKKKIVLKIKKSRKKDYFLLKILKNKKFVLCIKIHLFKNNKKVPLKKVINF